MRLPVKITSSCIWVAIPVDWTILHWYACGTDGRSVGVRYVITKFSRMGSLQHFFTHGAPLRAPRARELLYNRRNWNDNLLLSYPSFISKLATLGDRSFTHAAPRLCNALSFDVRCAKSVNVFKVKLKTHLFSIIHTYWALLPSQGFRPEGEIPRRHSSNSLVY